MRTLCFCLSVCLAGCASSSGRAVDPHFIEAWNDDSRNREIQTRDEYLMWVNSFYDGTPLVPGWARRQEELCGSLDPEQAALAALKLEALGRLLAAEWAKDNRVRRVDSNFLVRLAKELADARDSGSLIETLDELLEQRPELISLFREP